MAPGEGGGDLEVRLDEAQQLQVWRAPEEAVGEGAGARHGQTQHPQHHRPCLHLAFVSSILTYGVVICEISNVELRE